MFPNLSLKAFPFLQYTMLLLALQWLQLCTDSSLVWFLVLYLISFFKRVVSSNIFSSVFEMVAHTLCAKFLIFFKTYPEIPLLSYIEVPYWELYYGKYL